MISRPGRGLLAVCLFLLAIPATAAPVLRSAEVRVTFASADACEVSLTLAVEGASDVEHRVDAGPASHAGVELLDLHGAERVGDLRAIGRTLALTVRPSGPTYSFRYRTRAPAARAHRCPLWLPVIPTDGRSRSIALSVQIPPMAAPGRSMPALRWTGSIGAATLGNLPAFVDAPFATSGGTPPWDLEQQMDAAALSAMAGALVVWARRRRR